MEEPSEPRFCETKSKKSSKNDFLFSLHFCSECFQLAVGTAKQPRRSHFMRLERPERSYPAATRVVERIPNKNASKTKNHFLNFFEICVSQNRGSDEGKCI